MERKHNPFTEMKKQFTLERLIKTEKELLDKTQQNKIRGGTGITEEGALI